MGFDNANDAVLDAVTPAAARKDWKDYENESEAKKKPKQYPGATADALTNDNAKAARARDEEKQKGNRFSSAPDHLEIPEQVVGSAHQFNMPMPRNVDPNGRKAWINIEVNGESMTSKATSFELPSLIGNGAETPIGASTIPLEFAPARPGAFPAVVTIHGNWDDGHRETRSVTVHAVARMLDAVPKTQPGFVKEDATDGVGSVLPPVAETTFIATAVDNLKTTNSTIASMRVQGVTAVEKENDKFKPPPDDKGIGQLLAELAVTMASAAIGGLAGGPIGASVAANAARLGLKAAEHKIEEAVAKGAEDVLKDVTSSYLKPAEKKKSEHSETVGGGASEGRGRPPVSEDKTISFFDIQREGIESNRAVHEYGLNELKQKLISTYGETSVPVVGGLRAVDEAMRTLAGTAKYHQATYTTEKLAAFKAQTALGSKQVDGAGQTSTVTNVDKARAEVGRPKVYDGVLDLEVVGAGAEDVRVISAAIPGMSRASVSRFASIDLATAGVPIFIRWGYRVIFRDEAGRVRIQNWGGAAHSESEVQSMALAEAVTNRILGKSLQSWGVVQIESNDRGE